MSERARLILTAVLTVTAVILTAITRRAEVGVLYCCAVVSVGLLANVRDARSTVVDAMWRRLGQRRPDLTYQRLNGYLIGWCLVVIAAFLLVLFLRLRGV